MNSLISDRDFSRFNDFLRNGAPGIDYHLLDDTLPSMNQIFSGENYFAVLFKPNQGSMVGHWVVLIKHTENRYEYFDCLGDDPPAIIFERLRELGSTITLEFSSRGLMDRTNSICGRWVFCRLLALPNNLSSFIQFFKKIKGITPDQLVSFLYNIPNPE